jgi:hypothetical protein
MNDRAQVRIVEVKDIAACGIEEGSAQRIDPFGSTDDSRLPTIREHQERGESMFNRILSAAGQRGGNKVQDRAFALVPHVSGSCSHRASQIKPLRAL